MPCILDKSARFTRVWSSRVRSCRFSFPALAFGLCAMTCLVPQASLGQAQLGSAETSFDEGPDKLPAVPNTPTPIVRAEVPAQIAQAILPPRHRNSSPAATRPAHAQVQDFHPKTVAFSKTRQPEGTLTAAR